MVLTRGSHALQERNTVPATGLNDLLADVAGIEPLSELAEELLKSRRVEGESHLSGLASRISERVNRTAKEKSHLTRTELPPLFVKQHFVFPF
jgi:hypothetical protein